ncbi:MAG: hypothetical protein IJ195_09535 [Lachnospiraceae bacterium]|nr:hypothetical protein [Lachnospiraceae bacterium]
MNKAFNIKKYTDILLIISIVILALTLIPMIVLGFFAHPLGDDFYYGVPAKEALESGKGIIGILTAAFNGTIEQYKIWQGTYSAMFLMHLPPQLLNTRLYGLYPAFIILFLTGSIFYATKPLFVTGSDNNSKPWLTTAALLAATCILFVPVCAETFYWYNGSVYYTGFLSLTLFFFGLFFRYRSDKKKYKLVICILLALFIAGGNYASLLPTVLILILLTFNDIISKKKKLIIPDALIIASFLFGFAVSVLAPGNALRQSTSYGLPAIKAIAKSILQCLGYLLNWTTPFYFLVLIALTPIFIGVIKKSSFTFKCPYLVCPVVFGVFCSSETPTFYAQSNGGAARVFDICFYMLILTITFIYYYILGAIVRLNEKKKAGDARVFIPCTAVLLVICIIFSIIRPALYTFMKPNSVTAATALISGDAAYYNSQYIERYKLIESAKKDNGDALVPAIDVPESLKGFINCGDISVDASANDFVARYFGLNSITAR